MKYGNFPDNESYANSVAAQASTFLTEQTSGVKVSAEKTGVEWKAEFHDYGQAVEMIGMVKLHHKFLESSESCDRAMNEVVNILNHFGISVKPSWLGVKSIYEKGEFVGDAIIVHYNMGALEKIIALSKAHSVSVATSPHTTFSATKSRGPEEAQHTDTFAPGKK